MTKSYNAKDIEVLEGLNAVRMRPGMYIGTTGSKGLHHLLWEIVDNAVDEATNGFADTITITLNKDKSITVTDNGRGIPVDKHPKLGISGVEVVFTQLHAGGKFNNDNYAYSGGLHGVGASVTNALSRWLKVEVAKDGYMHEQTFHSVENEHGEISSGIPATTLTRTHTTDMRGSRITFLADDRVFHHINYNTETIVKRIKELAFLNRGIQFVVTDCNSADDDGNEMVYNFCYQGGLQDFVLFLNGNKAPVPLTPMYYSGANEVLQIEFALQYTHNYTDHLVTKVN